jgi:hypothetical protein
MLFVERFEEGAKNDRKKKKRRNKSKKREKRLPANPCRCYAIAKVRSKFIINKYHFFGCAFRIMPPSSMRFAISIHTEISLSFTGCSFV